MSGHGGVCSHGLALEASEGGKGLWGCHESPLIENFLILKWVMGEPAVFIRRLEVHDPIAA